MRAVDVAAEGLRKEEEEGGGFVAGGCEMCGKVDMASSGIGPSRRNCLHRMHQDATRWIRVHVDAICRCGRRTHLMK